MRIGQGYDLHRLVEGRKMYLGGVEIPSGKGEDAHSDGDVLIHAIIDAIFGAYAMGDIGSHFPPSDPAYKDIDSKELLKKAIQITGAKIINLDSTVILEKTKLRRHIESIRESLSDLLGVDISRVSVKAKTNEGCDAAGRDEAVEAHAVVLIED